MRFRLRTLLIMAAAVPPMFAWVWNMPVVTQVSNCGGNNAARAYLHIAAMTMSMFAEESSDKSFSVKSATPAQRQELADCCAADWGVCEGDIWITTKKLRVNDNKERSIVVVCSRPFTNVPQYMVRRAPPSHAAAFSDGSTALISADEFSKLDRSAFLPVNKITPSP